MRFEVALPPDFDVQVADELRVHLLGSGAAKVEPIRVRHTPASGRPAEAERPAELVELAGFMVSFAGDLMQAIEVLQGWLGMRRRSRTGGDQGAADRTDTRIRMQIGDDFIEITNPLLEHEERLVELFVRKHGGHAGGTERS
ncbi:hypothetical protein E1264_01850 [Actinomadura sp. KC216]|uniref:hypothetical protein n=1 Tax=Actinomadura sp. KC216 TaxID=2530370 RepID=UPI00104828EF|nr:hypothetical protein [Actinomadura sp. KC216]TDB91397.1 hypothetical protein E1264_01850 [Actinomadura sp. KC216]